MATLQDMETALVNAHRAGDSDAARKLASAIVDARNPKPVEPTAMEQVADVVTGNLRKTKETQTLPEWTTMPELNEFSAASAKSGLGTLLAPTAEIPKILQAQYPGVQARQDEKGNHILRSSKDGKEYAIPPGLTWGDLPRVLGAFAAFTPAGRAATLPGMAAAGAGTQAAIEATQAATGGDFNPGDVVVAGAIPPAAAVAVRGASSIAGGLREMVMKKLAAKNAAPAQPAAAAATAPPAAPPVTAPAAPPAAVAPPVAPLPPQQLAATATRAAGGSTRARDVLASQASPDAETLEAAKRLGIADNLQPDHITTNQAYRELAQAVKSVPGSTARAAELEGLEAVAKRADDLVTQMGAADDVADLGVRLRGTMQATVTELEGTADNLYAKVRQLVPPATPVTANKVLAVIKQRADDLGGAENLSPMERRILGRLSPKKVTSADGAVLDRNPTYALLDDVRRDVGAVTSRAGPFKDADTGLAKRLYSAIADDQLAAAEAHGAADTYRAAQAAIRTRKGVEDDLVAIFGKALDRSLSPALASSVGRLAAGDVQGLARLIQATPAPMRREVVASGLQFALTGGAKKQAVSFPSYARWYEGLRANAPAYALIAKNLDEQSVKQLNDLYKVSKGIAAATRERITTGRIQAVKEELQGVETLAGKLYHVAAVGGRAVAAETGSTTMGLPGVGTAAVFAQALSRQKTDVIKAVDAIISSREFLKLASKYQATGTVDPGLAKKLAYSKVFKRLAGLLKDPKALSNPEQFILTAMQAQRQRETSAAPMLPAPSRTVH